MDFTPEEKTELLLAFRPLLKKTVRRACVCYGLNTAQVYEDLFQTATEGFLRHLKSVNALYKIGGCWQSLYNYVVDDIRRMHVISISRAEFPEMHGNFTQLPLEESLNASGEAGEDQWISDLIVEEFLAKRTPKEREALLMKAEHRSTHKELMPVIGKNNEMGVTRFFRRMQKEYARHTTEKDGC